MPVATEHLSLVPDAPSRALALVEDKKHALDLLSLSPSFFPRCRNPRPKRRHGRNLTEPPPLATVDRSLLEQIELEQKDRPALLFLLLQAIELGRPTSTQSSRLLRRRPPRRRRDSVAVRPPLPPPSKPTRRG